MEKYKIYKLGVCHLQVFLSKSMLLEASQNKDGTTNLHITNTKFIKPVLGKKITLKEAIKEKGITNLDKDWVQSFVDGIQNLGIEITKLKIKK